MAEIEIGIYKSARRAYGFDDIAIVPSRRTRDPEDVDISWEIDAHTLRAAADGRGNGRRHEPAHRRSDRQPRRSRRAQPRGTLDPIRGPGPAFEEIADLPDDKATARMQQMYSEPIRPELVTARIKEIKSGGVVAAASVTPQRTAGLAPAHPGGRAGRARHPGHRRLRGARVQDHRAAQPEAVHQIVRHSRDRRRVRLLPGGTSPDAHGSGRCPRRGGTRERMHFEGRSRHRGASGDCNRGRRRRTDAPSRRDRRIRARDRRRRHQPRRRHREGDRMRRGRGHARFPVVVRRRGAVRGIPLGDGDLPPDAARVARGSARACAGPWSRSFSDLLTRTTVA